MVTVTSTDPFNLGLLLPMRHSAAPWLFEMRTPHLMGLLVFFFVKWNL